MCDQTKTRGWGKKREKEKSMSVAGLWKKKGLTSKSGEAVAPHMKRKQGKKKRIAPLLGKGERQAPLPLLRENLGNVLKEKCKRK